MDFLEKSNVMDLIPGIRELMNKYPGKIFAPVDVAVEVDGKRKELAFLHLHFQFFCKPINPLRERDFYTLPIESFLYLLDYLGSHVKPLFTWCPCPDSYVNTVISQIVHKDRWFRLH